MPRPRSYFLFALLVGGVHSALVPLGVAQETPLRTFSSTATCRSCSIETEPQVTLALPTDSLSFYPFIRITRLANGQFVAGRFNETPIPAIFDQAGRFQRLIGRRGQGPGELERVSAVVVANGDTVWVTDGPRKHVYTPDMRYVIGLRKIRLTNSGLRT